MPPQRKQGTPSRQSAGSGAPSALREEIRYPIPRASAQAWQTIKSQRDVRLNPGLIFDRFVQDWGWREQHSRDKEAKKKAWQEIVAFAPRVDPGLLAAWNERWQAAARSVSAEPFSLKTDWRLVPGLGSKGALEAGFTFNRYGLPILPGSSVKGVARTWALSQIAEKSGAQDLGELDKVLSADREERKEYEVWHASAPPKAQALADDFRSIFGTGGVAGRAVFFDAIPNEKPELELDIMNPHFPDYYGDDPKHPKKYPTDWQSPIPVYFLTVASGTEFRFAVGWRGPLNTALREMAENWLKEGLMNLGAGAKTSAGYGYFK
jgi:CRISPR-associated protein Cmr6